MFKNTVKILLNNFSSVWKILLYKIITIICIMGLTTVICLPIINQLLNQNFFGFMQDNISNLFLNFNLNSFVEILMLILNKFYEIISNANLLPLAISVGACALVVYYFVDSLLVLPVVEDTRSFMSNNYKLGFMNCYIANFGKSAKYSLVKLGTVFIWNLFIIAGSVGIYYALSKTVLVIAPLVTIVFALLMYCLKTTLLVGVETAIVVHNCGIFEAVKRSFKATSKKFLTIFSASLMIAIILLLLNMFGIFFTFGVTNLILLPLSLLTMLIFKNVVYFECTGMRYYVDSDTIMMPKKLEEQDKFSKVKDII